MAAGVAAAVAAVVVVGVVGVVVGMVGVIVVVVGDGGVVVMVVAVGVGGGWRRGGGEVRGGGVSGGGGGGQGSHGHNYGDRWLSSLSSLTAGTARLGGQRCCSSRVGLCPAPHCSSLLSRARYLRWSSPWSLLSCCCRCHYDTSPEAPPAYLRRWRRRRGGDAGAGCAGAGCW